MTAARSPAPLRELFERAGFPENLIAVNTDFSDDIATVLHVGDWRVGIHTGIPGGNYRDADLGFDEAQARFIVALIEMFRAGAITLPSDTQPTYEDGLEEILAYLRKEYLTSKPAADVLDGLEKHIRRVRGRPGHYR